MKKSTIVTALYIVCLFCACKKDDNPTASVPTEIEGRWTGYEVNGNPGIWSIQFAGNRVNASGPGNAEWYTGSFALQSDVSPKALNVSIEQCSVPAFAGKTSLSIYKMSGDTLTVAANEPGHDVRPSQFRVVLGKTRLHVLLRSN